MKNLTKILLLGTPLLLGIGCSTPKPLVNGIVYGTEFGQKTNNKSRYQLEDVTFFDEKYYILNENPSEANTLPFKLTPFNTTHQQFTYGATIPKIAPEEKYVLKKLEMGSDFLDNVELTDIKAYVQNTRQNKTGYKTVTTEKGLSYDIPFTIINQREYFYFLLNLNNKKTLGMIPCEKAIVDVKNGCGNISLLTIDEVYAIAKEQKIATENVIQIDNSTYYTVKQGDYFYKIAKEKNIPAKILMELNPQIQDFGKIKVGQQIKLK